MSDRELNRRGFLGGIAAALAAAKLGRAKPVAALPRVVAAPTTITSFTVTNCGSGYTSFPRITFSVDGVRRPVGGGSER